MRDDRIAEKAWCAKINAWFASRLRPVGEGEVVINAQEWLDARSAICWCEISAFWSETRKALAKKYEEQFRLLRAQSQATTNEDRS